MATFSQPFKVTATAAGGPGPVVSNGTLVNVNFASGAAGPPGNWNNQLVTPYVWGVSSGALINNADHVPFSTWGDTTLQSTFAGLGFQFLRMNATAPILESIFGQQGGTIAGQGTVNFGDGTILNATGFPLFDNMFNYGNLLFPSGARVVMGLGNQPDQWSNANFQNVINQVATYLWQNNSRFPIFGFEFSNEYDNMNPSYYTSGIAGMNAANLANGSAYKFFGPTWDYWGGGNATNFKNAVGSNCYCYDFHAYGWGPGGAAIPSDPTVVMASQFALGNLQHGVTTWTGAGGPATTPMMIGEWNMDDSGYGANYNFNYDSYQCTYPGACFAANAILGGLNGAQYFQYGGIWEAYQDTDYGVVGAQDNNGGYNISPSGYVLSKGSAVGYGTRCAWSQVSNSNPALTGFAVHSGPGPSNFCVIMINPTASQAQGTVALSSWPVNGSGTETADLYTVGQNNTTGSSSTVPVTNGTTASITVPAGCVTFLYF